MMRSLRSREKISYARSPRGVCSTTMGTSATAPPTLARRAVGRVSFSLGRFGRLTVGRRLDLRVLDEERDGLGLAERQPHPVELVAALEQAPDGLGRAPRFLGQPRDLRVHVRLGGGDLLARRDGLEEEGAAHRALALGPELRRQLLVVPAHGIRIHALAPQAL